MKVVLTRRERFIVSAAIILLIIVELLNFDPKRRSLLMPEEILTQKPSLDELLSLLSSPQRIDPTKDIHPAIAQAIRARGTNDLPKLMAYLQDHPSWFEVKLLQLRGRYYKDWGIHSEKQPQAALAIYVLGERARSVAPELQPLLQNVNFRSWATLALSGIEPEGPQILVSALSDTNLEVRQLVAYRLRNTKTNYSLVIPALIRSLDDSILTVSDNAAESLAALQKEPLLVVPALAAKVDRDGSRSYQALTALGSFGNHAKPAIPIIRRTLTNSDSVIREAATNALKQIAPEMLR